MSTVYWIGGTGSCSWTATANWSGGAAPATGDIVYIRNASSSIDSGLSNTSVLLAQLIIEQTFTGRLGDTAGTPLAIGATYCRIGDNGGATGTTPAGSGAIILNTGTNTCTLEVTNTKSSGTDSGLEPVRWIGNNTANAVVVTGGTVGIGTTSPTQTATLGSLSVGSNATVNSGPGVSWAGATNKGTLLLQSANGTNTALVNLGGTCTIQGPVYINSVAAKGGTVDANNRVASGSSIGTLTMQGGTVDFSGEGRAVTIASTSFRSGTITLFSDSQATFTAMAIDFTNKDSPAATVG